MKSHFEHWLTEQDIKEIATLGFNSVRVPVGYWNIIETEESSRLFVPSLATSDAYLHSLFTLTKKYNLQVIIDLHGAAGSQNGIDHSGCNFGVYFDGHHYLEQNLETIEAIMIKYGSKYSNFVGIELLNEPNEYLTYEKHDLLVKYYQASYEIIRKYHKSCYVIINELYQANFLKWKNDLQEPAYYNVFMDYHLYNWQWPYDSNTPEQHLWNVRSWGSMIESNNKQHPIIIGEWSMSTGILKPQVGLPFVDQCVKSFEKSFGWFLWSWKLERNPNFDAWNVKYQMIEKEDQGYNPLALVPAEYLNPLAPPVYTDKPQTEGRK